VQKTEAEKKSRNLRGEGKLWQMDQPRRGRAQNQRGQRTKGEQLGIFRDILSVQYPINLRALQSNHRLEAGDLLIQ
jgi:hypothetical protein